MTNAEIIRILDLIAGMSTADDPSEAAKNIFAYCQMLKDQILNQIVELPTSNIKEIK